MDEGDKAVDASTYREGCEDGKEYEEDKDKEDRSNDENGSKTRVTRTIMVMMTRGVARKRRRKQARDVRWKQTGDDQRMQAREDRKAVLRSQYLFRVDSKIVWFSRRTARSIGVRLEDYSEYVDY